MNRVYPPVRGASGRVLRDLARSFAREGWQVTVITTGPEALVERDGAVKIVRLKAPQKPNGFLAYFTIWFRMLIEAMKLPATHLLVTMTDPPMLVCAGQIIRFFKKNRHMHWCQDLYPDVLPSLGFKMPHFMLAWLHAISRHSMRAADKVIVPGRCMARHLSVDGFDPKQITVIPNWPDIELVSEAGLLKGQLSHKKANGHVNGAVNGSVNGALNGGSNGTANGHAPFVGEEGDLFYREHESQVKYGPKFRVLYAGNIGRAHPIETIIDAAELLNEQEKDIEFVFVGDGPVYDQIAHMRSKRHLDNIRLLPFQPVNRLKDLMMSGDIHLVSMSEEAAGMVVPSKIYSAIAAERPCLLVGPAQSEVAKVIVDFEAGSVVPQGQAALLAEEIRQMRFNSDKWFRAHEGAAEAAKIFVPKESINAWIERAWAVVEPEVR